MKRVLINISSNGGYVITVIRPPKSVGNFVKELGKKVEHLNVIGGGASTPNEEVFVATRLDDAMELVRFHLEQLASEV